MNIVNKEIAELLIESSELESRKKLLVERIEQIRIRINQLRDECTHDFAVFGEDHNREYKYCTKCGKVIQV
jgi:hypothetical protein